MVDGRDLPGRPAGPAGASRLAGWRQRHAADAGDLLHLEPGRARPGHGSAGPPGFARVGLSAGGLLAGPAGHGGSAGRIGHGHPVRHRSPGRQGGDQDRPRARAVRGELRHHGDPGATGRGAGVSRPALRLDRRPLGNHRRLAGELDPLCRRPRRAGARHSRPAARPVVRLAPTAHRFAVALAGGARRKQRRCHHRGRVRRRLIMPLAQPASLRSTKSNRS